MIFHFLNNTFVTEQEATFSPFDLGLLRGYGVFDYVQLYQGKPFHLGDHLERLKWSAEQIDLDLPMDIGKIKALTLQLIDKNPPIDAGIRFLITGGLCGKEFLLPANQSELGMLFHPFQSHPERYYTEGMRVVTFHSNRTYPCVKATNYTHAILAMKKAEKARVDDAIYLNSSQELLEATTSNLFVLKDGKWITAKNDQVVNGVTRTILLELAKEHYPIEFRALHLDEIEACDEAFLCSSVKDAVPVVQIDDKKVGTGLPGAHTAKMRSLFHRYLEDYLSQKHEYLAIH
jgi:branched-chain amino acid aminotransferase